MFRVEIIQKGKPFGKWIAEIQQIAIESKQEVKDIAVQATQKMKEMASDRTREKRDHSIDTNPKASKESIEQNIDLTIVEDTAEKLDIGIGNISKLNQNAPHWAAQNFGSWHIVGKQVGGEFTNPSNGVFYGNKSGNSMTPRKPIPPKNYVERTMLFITNELRLLIQNLSRSK